MTPDEVAIAARAWINTPWRHQGRTKQGLDCIGFIQRVADAFGVPYEDKRGYPREPNSTEFLRHLRRFLTPVPGNVILPGAIGVFAQSKYPCHVGIFSLKSGVTHLIHASVARRAVVEEPYEPLTTAIKLVEVGMFPNLEV